MGKNLTIKRVRSAVESTFKVPATVTTLRITPQLAKRPVVGRHLIANGGNTVSWGRNDYGQLGDGTSGVGADKSSPVAVVGGHSFSKVASCEGGLSFGIKSDGSVWAWGLNNLGQLGDGTIVNKSSPVAVTGAHVFSEIGSPGYTFAMGALKSDGSAWMWGRSDSGLLGDGTTVHKSSPVAVIGGHSFVQLAIGSAAVALKADGSAWAWGSNQYGQLGAGLTAGAANSRSSPVAVTGGHSFKQISAANDFNVGLRTDGAAYAWGNNVYGQLGDGTVVAKNSPTAVSGSHVFTKIVAMSLSGTVGSVAGLKKDGTILCWGDNSSGQLGDGTVVSKSSPVAVIGGHRFVDIGVFGGCFGGIKADGSIMTWGAGQGIGDGTVVAKSSPVAVVGSARFLRTNINPSATLKVTPGQTIPFLTGNYSYFGDEFLGVEADEFVLEYFS